MSLAVPFRAPGPQYKGTLRRSQRAVFVSITSGMTSLRPVGYVSFLDDIPDNAKGMQRKISEVDASQIQVEPEQIRNIKVVKSDEICRRAFRSHLRQCHAEENLDFVLAVDEYENAAADARPGLLHEIYDTFLAEDALKPISVDWAARQEIRAGMDNACPHLFWKAKRMVELALEHDQLHRFRSHVAKKLDACSYDESNLRTLDQTLSCIPALRDFREYLKDHYCDENLDFILTAVEYEKCDNVERRRALLNEIVDTFLLEDAKRPVSIDWSIQQSILHNLDNPPENLLLMAKRMVTITIEHEHLKEFRRTLSKRMPTVSEVC